jgi:plasmid replication initiation protein
MLSLKDPAGKEPEQYEKISASKKYVLDTAVTQINGNTDLLISYELFKKGRNFEEIRLYIKNQIPQQIPIPFEEHVDDAKIAAARQHLEVLKIKDPALVKKVLEDPKLIRALFDFIYKMKTERIKAKTNPGGLFLTIYGLI